MKPQNLLRLAVFAPALFCPAQTARNNTANASFSVLPSTIPAPANVATAKVDESYVIGPLDVLTVAVWKEQALSSSLLVRPDGMISIPLIGDIQAANLTPLQLSDQISKQLKKYIQDPNVTVVVSQIHSRVVYLLGQIGKKGPIEMTPGMTLLEAISIAGGPTDYAHINKIYILRSEGIEHVKLPVRYKGALKGDSSCNLALKADDTIVIP